MNFFALIFRFFQKNFEKQVDSVGLGVFRILYSIVLLGEVAQLYYFRHLVYDKVPYVVLSEIDFGIPIIIWGASIVLVMVGLYTRQAAILNYLMTVILIGTIDSYEYHMFYSFVGLNFLLILMPVSQRLSLDRLRAKLKYSSIRSEYSPPVKVSKLYYQLPILLGVGLVYLDSTLYKLASEIWMSGLGAWLPASMPMASHFDSTWLMNIKWLVIFLGYFTIVFELLFSFLFWFKPFRLPLFIIGVGLHLGIVLEFPLPWFGLGVVALYVLLLPVRYWGVFNLKHKPGGESESLKFFYDAECPLCLRTKIILGFFDWRKSIDFKKVQLHAANESALAEVSEEQLLSDIYSVDKKNRVYRGIDTYVQAFSRIPVLMPLGLLIRIPGIYHLGAWVYGKVAENRTVHRCTEESCGIVPQIAPPPDHSRSIFAALTYQHAKIAVIIAFVAIFSVFQLGVSYVSPFSEVVRDSVGFKGTYPDRVITKFAKKPRKFSQTFFGITTHGLFFDTHFTGYNHLIGVTHVKEDGTEEWLPIITEEGMTGRYLVGPTYAKWTFRVVGPNVDQAKFVDGVRDFTAFWATKNNVDLNNSKFNIKYKKIIHPTGWEKDYLRKQNNLRWSNAGTVEWKDRKFFADVPEIESL